MIERLPESFLDQIDAETMLNQVISWSAINTGTSNLDGLANQALELANAFSVLPGDIKMVDAAKVSSIDHQGIEIDKPHGQHMMYHLHQNGGMSTFIKYLIDMNIINGNINSDSDALLVKANNRKYISNGVQTKFDFHC